MNSKEQTMVDFVNRNYLNSFPFLSLKEVTKEEFYFKINPLEKVELDSIYDGSKARNFLHYGPIVGTVFHNSFQKKIFGVTEKDQVMAATKFYYLVN